VAESREGGKWFSMQGRIKEIVGPRHFSSVGPFGDSKIIVGSTLNFPG
jgi:hypothetical protein